MSGLHSVIAAYLISSGLLGGYVLWIWLNLRRLHRKGNGDVR